jgi:all-trans-retinol dehydrogenase (NAD+)
MAVSKQPSKPDIKFREPITWDLCYAFLNKTAFSPLAFLAIPALTYLIDKRKSPVPSAYPAVSYTHLRGLLSTSSTNPYKWVARLFWFGLFKNLNRALNRYVRNHGEWRADKPNWKKEVVVITGGAAGIGKATVEILSHEKRAKIAVLDMAPPTYAPAPRGAPEILYFKVDVSNKEEVHKVAEEIRAKLGEPTILMNCAGVAVGATILESQEQSINRVWRVNTLANWVTVQEFLPHMISKNHGHVMTVASSASYMSLPQMAEYATSKNAALSFHEVLAGELNARYFARKIRTSVCCPTKVRTALGDGMEDHDMQFLTPNLMPIQVGRAIVNAFDSGLSQHLIMPQFMRILSGIRVYPDWLRRGIQLAGKTDQTVSTKSIDRAIKNGYGANWEGTDKEMREAFLASRKK